MENDGLPSPVAVDHSDALHRDKAVAKPTPPCIEISQHFKHGGDDDIVPVPEEMQVENAIPSADAARERVSSSLCNTGKLVIPSEETSSIGGSRESVASSRESLCVDGVARLCSGLTHANIVGLVLTKSTSAHTSSQPHSRVKRLAASPCRRSRSYSENDAADADVTFVQPSKPGVGGNIACGPVSSTDVPAKHGCEESCELKVDKRSRNHMHDIVSSSVQALPLTHMVSIDATQEENQPPSLHTANGVDLPITSRAEDLSLSRQSKIETDTSLLQSRIENEDVPKAEAGMKDTVIAQAGMEIVNEPNLHSDILNQALVDARGVLPQPAFSNQTKSSWGGGTVKSEYEQLVPATEINNQACSGQLVEQVVIPKKYELPGSKSKKKRAEEDDHQSDDVSSGRLLQVFLLEHACNGTCADKVNNVVRAIYY